MMTIMMMIIPGSSVGKESVFNAGGPGSIPGQGRSTGEGFPFLGFPYGSAGKESICNEETWVRSLGWKDALQMGEATHSSILAQRIPQTVQSMGVTKSQTRLSNFHNHDHDDG